LKYILYFSLLILAFVVCNLTISNNILDCKFINRNRCKYIYNIALILLYFFFHVFFDFLNVYIEFPSLLNAILTSLIISLLCVNKQDL